MAVDESGFGSYLAGSYVELIDHPVEMADFQRIDFDVDGVPHALILSGRCEPDAPRLAADLRRVCHAQRELFGQQPGLRQYLFLTQVTANGYGGLEHRASTALVCARDALPRPGQTGLRKGYRGFLGLVSHEYFHLWNVKRITPRRFAESSLAAEAYSRDLWAYEGITSYYDDLMLLRAGLLDAPAYLDLLAEAATRLQRTPGRLVQTVADASFEAWIKYYQPDENTPNAAVNYYIKGSLAALCLDLTLRLHSSTTLDDVMRTLWTRYGRDDRPVPESGLEQIAAELSGLDLRALFDSMLRSTAELPLAELLAEFGIKAALRPASGPGDEGGRGETTAAAGLERPATARRRHRHRPGAQRLAGRTRRPRRRRCTGGTGRLAREQCQLEQAAGGPDAGARGERALLPRRRAAAYAADAGAAACRHLGADPGGWRGGAGGASAQVAGCVAEPPHRSSRVRREATRIEDGRS